MTPKSEVTADDVASWMLAELNQVNYLYQQDAAWKIQQQFGEQFVYYNPNGNLAIGAGVLRAFRKITDADVIWERGQRMWRRRLEFDDPGRRQS